MGGGGEKQASELHSKLQSDRVTWLMWVKYLRSIKRKRIIWDFNVSVECQCIHHYFIRSDYKIWPKEESFGLFCLVRDSSFLLLLLWHGDVFNSFNSNPAPFFCTFLTASLCPALGTTHRGTKENPLAHLYYYWQFCKVPTHIRAAGGDGGFAFWHWKHRKELSGRQQLSELLIDWLLNAAGFVLQCGWSIRRLRTMCKHLLNYYLNGRKEISA